MVDKFTFFRSYYESLKEVPEEYRLPVLWAIFEHVFEGVEPDLSGIPKALYTLVLPNVDKSVMRSEIGKRGGEANGNHDASDGCAYETQNEKQNESKGEANSKQTKSKTEANVKQTRSDKDKEKDKDKDMEEEKKPTRAQAALVDASDLSNPVKASLKEWLKYKTERREGYKETGLTALITQVSNRTVEFGDKAVCDLITESMGNGWKGIAWEKLKEQPRPTARSSPYMDRISNRVNIVDEWVGGQNDARGVWDDSQGAQSGVRGSPVYS